MPSQLSPSLSFTKMTSFSMGMVRVVEPPIVSRWVTAVSEPSGVSSPSHRQTLFGRRGASLRSHTTFSGAPVPLSASGPLA